MNVPARALPASPCASTTATIADEGQIQTLGGRIEPAASWRT
jgi:hypothetical protein